MKKIRLSVDDLRVASFETAEQGGGRGTVEGHATLRLCPATGHTCEQGSCAEIGTCNVLLTGSPCIGC